MKRFILSAFAVLFTAVSLVGCGHTQSQAENKTEIRATAVSEQMSSEQKTEFTIEDARDLQNFLLARPTDKDLSGKPYDLDGDGAWTVFDLCLMRRQLLQSKQTTGNDSNNTLVVYFSRTGNTKMIAEYLLELTDADSYEIEAAVPYTDEDIEYSNSSCRANKEQNDKIVRPEIAEPIDSLEQYDVIYLGYPIWWGEEPRIIDTFLESYDFSDKTVIPFCTSHSSGIGTSLTNIENLVPIGNQIEGRRFSATSTKNEVEEWIDSLDIKKNTITENNIVDITVNGATIKAHLYDNQAADSFKELLPYSLTVSRAADDLCGSVSEKLNVNSEEDSETWSIGEIGWFDGWFTILCDNEEGMRKRKRTIIGKIDEEDIAFIQSLKGTVNMTISLENDNASQVGKFDLETKRVLLNSGYIMPINGIGTYSLLDDTCVSSVKEALKDGVRLIDTAYMYHNEEAVGQAVREAMEEYGIKREEIFVITKLYPGEQYSNPEEAIEQALEKLDIGYIDMMLLHHPGTNDVKAYKTMEKYVASGKIKSLGLSNWYIKELGEFLPQVSIKPALVQNEIHPFYQESEVVDYIHSLDIVVQGWYPLGGRGYTSELLNNEVITKIAENHNVSSAQVILRWDLQNGVIVIPGSSNPAHIKENNELYHFELTDDEMNAMAELNRDEKHDWY